MAITITRHAHSWTIETPVTSGEFANGDPWVAPIFGTTVTISNISPASTNVSGRIRNGTMVNPSWSPAQGFDSSRTQPAYNAANNRGRPGGNDLSLSNPLVVSVGSTVVSMETNVNPNNRPSGVNGAVLTVLATAPASGSFRPPWTGTDKTIRWNKSDIDWSKIPNLPKPPGYAPIATLISLSDKWDATAHNDPSHGRYGRVINNEYSYGASYAAFNGLCLQSLCLDFPQTDKEQLAIRMIQRGIDIWGLCQQNYTCVEGGALGPGLKGVMVFAGHVLNNSTLIRNQCPGSLLRFAEDRQCFVVSTSDVGRQMIFYDGKQYQTYTSDMVGLPEWGEKHTRDPQWDTSSWPDERGYRNQNFEGIMSQTNAIRVMGARTLWGKDAVFDYADRIWSKEGSKSPIGNKLGPFNDQTTAGICALTHAFYTTYRQLGDGTGGGTPTDPAVTTPIFSPSYRTFLDSVSVDAAATYPPEAVIRYTLDGTDPTESSPLLSAPVVLTTTTQVKVRGFAPGYNPSAITSALFTQRALTSTSSSWSNVPCSAQTAEFTASCRVTPSFGGLDGVVGFAAAEVGSYSAMAVIVQFATNGLVNARNGGVYSSVTPFTYSAGVAYQVDFTIDPGTKTYSVTITAPGGSPVVIASGYAFRLEQSSVDEINFFSSFTAGANSMLVDNIYVGSAEEPTEPAPPPTTSPVGGNFYGSVAVAISSTLAGGVIRYTTDGSDPNGSSPIYTVPIIRTSTTLIKAIVTHPSYLPSSVVSVTVVLNELTLAFQEFSDMSLQNRVSDLTMSFVVRPSAITDAVFGIGSGPMTQYDDLAVCMRLSNTGQIEAYDGAGYSSVNAVSYVADTDYLFELSIDQETRTYDLTVTPSGGSATVVANNYAYRANASSLAYLSGTISPLAGVDDSVQITEVALTEADIVPPTHVIVRRFVNARRRR